MANRTDPAAKTVHGTNPQNLVEKIVREKIYQNAFWKEQCFALTAETLVDKAMELNHIGGTYGGNRKPTPFICLTLKMLQIQPEKEIVVEFIKNGEYKYVRALGAFYLRLVGKPTDVYQYLEPLYNDYRKMRRRNSDGSYVVCHVDEFIDELLTSDYSCDIALPRVPKRSVLEQNEQLEPRKSALEDDFEEEEEKEAEEEEAPPEEIKEPEKEHRDKERDKERHHRERDREREREHDRDRDRERHRERRDRDRDRDRDHESHRERERERNRDRDRAYYRRDLDRRDGRDSERYHRRRSRSRSCDRDSRREERRRSRSPIRRRDNGPIEEGEHRPNEDKQQKPKKKAKKEDNEKKLKTEELDPEIVEANKLRASLGLKPLR